MGVSKYSCIAVSGEGDRGVGAERGGGDAHGNGNSGGAGRPRQLVLSTQMLSTISTTIRIN